ncbi:cytochrome P450 [Colletotrichum paranaense]|uniref:Cytochrome P450 n=1 Tax=Colletotrichum paranaense TaxID=1914294 RepID=A0ABQ9T7D9_9PEZI|nr:cytochrome P450 [Colletotrichum paranaense]KAK1547699.1 cytochrome P450 [Colletotrichum paranaense]
MLRLAHTATSQDRECKEDTVILGHVIPKGTTVIVPNRGPSFTEPGYEIEERLRSTSSRKAATDFGSRVWDSQEMGKSSRIVGLYEMRRVMMNIMVLQGRPCPSALDFAVASDESWHTWK